MKSKLQRSSTALLVAMVGLSLVFSAGCTKKTKKAKEATELPSDKDSDSKPTETSGIDSAPSGDAIDGKGSSDLASGPRTDDTFAANDGGVSPAGGSTGGSFEGLESRHGSAAIGEPHGDAGLTPAAPAPVEEELAQAPAPKKKKKKGKKKKQADLEAPIETADADAAAGGDDHGGGYLVKKGDVMSKIAKQHGVSLKSLLSANKMTMDQASKLKVGQKLKIPAGAGKAD
jgi:nucleoid-associated protein YgaU